MSFQISKQIVTAKSRTLSANWTHEAMQDTVLLNEAAWEESMCKLHPTLNAVKHEPEKYQTIKALLGISYDQYKIQNANIVENTLSNILADEIQKEINAEIVRSLKF